MAVEVGDPGLEAGLEMGLGHGAPFSEEELRGVTLLTAMHVRDASALRHMTSVTHLALVGCEITDLEPLRGHPALFQVEVTYSSVSDISALATCPSLSRVILRCDSVADASPLLERALLLEVDLVGNPLDDASWNDVRPRLQEKAMKATFSGEEAWRLTRELRARGLRACYYEDGDTHRLCVPGLTFNDHPEGAHPAIPPDALRKELERSDLTLEHLFRTYPVRPGASMEEEAGSGTAAAVAEVPGEIDFDAHREVGGATEARGWVRDSALSKEDKAALLRFIDRFADQRFYRVDEAWLDGSQAEDGVRYPAWFRDVYLTLSYIDMPGVHFKLCFDRVGEEDEGEDPCYWTNIRGPTEEERQGVVEKARLYPLGDGGGANPYTLAISLKEDDRRVYRYRTETGSRRGFSGGTVVFDSYTAMLDRVRALRLPDGTRIEARE
jgi:hypothetical protein